jgi:hypothetical protein
MTAIPIIQYENLSLVLVCFRFVLFFRRKKHDYSDDKDKEDEEKDEDSGR